MLPAERRLRANIRIIFRDRPATARGLKLVTEMRKAIVEECANIAIGIAMRKGIIAPDQNALVDEIAEAIRGRRRT